MFTITPCTHSGFVALWPFNSVKSAKSHGLGYGFWSHLLLEANHVTVSCCYCYSIDFVLNEALHRRLLTDSKARRKHSAVPGNGGQW